MDKSTARAVVVAIFIVLIVVSWSVFLSAVRHSDRKADAVSVLGAHGLQEPLSVFAVELAEITNSITGAFHIEDRSHSHVGSCVTKTFERIDRMTNATLRLAVARHLAGEVLQLNLTNENYHFRWQHIDDAVDSICYADRCLLAADSPEMERCKFFFDALVRVKEAFLTTLTEPSTKPTDLDRYGRGEVWAQSNCRRRVRDYFVSAPKSLNNGVFRLMYPKLSPEAQSYFKTRFREVFGIDYLPDKPGARAYLHADEGTRWDGRGLKWRICDDNGNWRDA